MGLQLKARLLQAAVELAQWGRDWDAAARFDQLRVAPGEQSERREELAYPHCRRKLRVVDTTSNEGTKHARALIWVVPANAVRAVAPPTITKTNRCAIVP